INLTREESRRNVSKLFSNSTCIVSGSSDYTVRIWVVATRAQLAQLDGHEGAIWSVDYSPDSTRIVSGGYDNTIRLWDEPTHLVQKAGACISRIMPSLTIKDRQRFGIASDAPLPTHKDLQLFTERVGSQH
ncbi:MAG: hypothetical protein AAF639_30085, partial [Chloroflexota bacterium]